MGDCFVDASLFVYRCKNPTKRLFMFSTLKEKKKKLVEDREWNIRRKKKNRCIDLEAKEEEKEEENL